MAKKMSPYDKALRMARREAPDFKKVRKLLDQARAEGDARATYAIATWYLHGAGSEPKNMRLALKFLREAAKANVPSALYDLAICYEKGAGVKKSDKRALELYMQAALYGDEQSIMEVGRCLYYGIGTDKDKQLARPWRSRAAELGLD